MQPVLAFTCFCKHTWFCLLLACPCDLIIQAFVLEAEGALLGITLCASPQDQNPLDIIKVESKHMQHDVLSSTVLQTPFLSFLFFLLRSLLYPLRILALLTRAWCTS